MREKVAKLGIEREKDFMYFIKAGAVWKVPRKRPGVPKGKQQKVADGGFVQDTDHIYFLDKDGDVSRSARAVGGQKRKKAAKVAKKPAKKVAAKKPVKKAPAKKAAAKKPAAKKAPAKKVAAKKPVKKAKKR